MGTLYGWFTLDRKMDRRSLKAFRKEIISQLEQRLGTSQTPENDIFYNHPSEDRIVLSHALFWVMTASVKGKVRTNQCLLLLRQYQEEMLEAWLTESPDFDDLLHCCNVIYNTLPTVLQATYNFCINKDARRLGAVCVVAGGYGGDMKEEQATELLDDIDFFYNKVKCRKIERLLPALNKLVVEEQSMFM